VRAADQSAFCPPSARVEPEHSNSRFSLLFVAFLSSLSASNLNAQLARHLPIYEAQDRILYAKVKMADGTSLPGLPAIEAICGGVAYPLGFADTQGNFRFILAAGGTRFNPGFNSEGATIDLSFLADCELRAEFPGLRSRHVSPSWLREMKDASTISVGTIQLLRPGEVRGDSSVDPPIPKPARDAYKKGGAALANGKWNEAKSEFEKAVSLQPANFVAWIGIGLADERLQQWHEAETAYQKALALRPKSAEPYLRIARLGARAGDWEQTAQYSEAALGLDPHNLVEGYSLCALANAKLGRMDTAGSSARAGLKLESASEYPELWLSMAFAQASGKHYADAMASLQKYLQLVPKAESVPEIKKELLEVQTLLSK
jgi:tetratricopeptide (TPR) repeat protein